LINRYAAKGRTVPVLYGGSVNGENASVYAHLPQCNGLGVGRAARRSSQFVDVLEGCLKPASKRRFEVNEHL
jgi:triosephosphate isomerase